ncbi:peptidoglycan-binding protein [Streptomyces sp. NTH33]|uniref:peptidoglycan-binding domain-containing protein n=1 Tax=Streptomyces sp. NTH33 TaxID=1735453 RepID=UPI000DA8E67F|nr:peptidoglycan-binding domain-containing protein [Streptomyces sp. NTH33]PZG93177.1 peptidoglycan-binding protein [Streptomyces sp. NTH33]
MEERRGHVCPECGAPRGTDNAPSCACGSRVSDALRDARTAEAAAAEDFDPLRIRPYVEIEEAEQGAGGTEGEESAQARPRGEPEGPAPVDATMPLRALPADATMPLRAVSADSTAPLRAVPADSTAPPRAGGAGLPTPLAPQRGGPNASDLTLFESTTGEPAADAGAGAGTDAEGPQPARRGGRRRTTIVLAGSAAAVAIVAAAGFTGALLSYDSPERDRASRSVREGVPEASADTSAAPSPTASGASSAPSASASASASGSPSAGESASPSPSSSASDAASQAAPSASASQAGTVPGAGSEQSGSEQSGPAQSATTLDAPAPPDPGPVLRHGDQGPEVTELQQRLRQLYLYNGRADGFYSGRVEKAVRTYQWARGISADESGVYGPATRASLESETRAP